MFGGRNETLVYYDGDLRLVGELFVPSGLNHAAAAVLVFPEAFGLGDHAKTRAARLADEFGFVSLACDLHGDGAIHDDFTKLMPLLAPLQTVTASARARTGSALAALCARPEVDPSRVAAIGFCFGGTLCYELALSGADLKAVVGFHSGLKVTAPGDAAAIRGRVLALLGADDPSVTAEDRAGFEAMLRDGGVDWEAHVFGGVAHSFTDPAADARGMPNFLRYDARADARSWRLMGDLLREALA